MAGDNWWMIKNNVQPNISKFENGLRIETEILVETNFRSFVFFILPFKSVASGYTLYH